jgi:polyphosphate kinase
MDPRPAGGAQPRYDRRRVSAIEQRPASEAVDLADPGLYFNRELSWLQFNQRVLELAEDPGVPLLERVKFLAIVANNLDEFFQVRVAGLHDQVDAGIETPLQDGRTPSETLSAIRAAVAEHTQRQARCLQDDVRPALAEHGIRIVGTDEVPEDERVRLDERFRRQIFPVLTPLAVGLGRPFPYISNLSLSLGVVVHDPVTRTQVFARVKVPTEMLPRFMPLADKRTFVPLENLIAQHLDQLFPGMEIIDTAVFRVTRDADFTVSDEADDLLQAVEDELRRRRFGEVVRVEVDAGMSREMRDQLVRALEAEAGDVFEIDGLLDLNDLSDIVKTPGFPELRDPPWTPITQPRLGATESEQPDVMGAMREGDILVHHPYDSFSTSVERLVEEAVADDDVLALKQTVYRTSDDSPLVPALIRAAERGKQAVCLVELKARFDERANIGWARALEEAGVHVVYGLPSLKTHAKCILIVRREGDGVRNYVHVGTGNYHPTTARLYTDFGLLTCDERIGADVADMFNYLTGFGRPRRYRQVLVAPAHLREGIIAEIERTIEAQREGRHARIAMKMNSLVDKRCIRALYAASQAGVPVDLNIRGICCLRPGVPGVSENVRVTSIVGRFLEHSRIFAFERDETRTVYIGSADLMPRNLDTRVELLAPVRDATLRAELLDTLERCFADDSNAWELGQDGMWTRLTPAGPEPRSIHRELMASHAERALERSTTAE